jgi:hypothetical protein
LWLGACLLVGTIIPVAHAGTWMVEQDGSGDFLEIQHAVDAAAAGDTIMIGPGRFDTFHPFTAPGWTEEVIVGVTMDNLTFIGSGKDVTVVGTSAPYGAPGEDPKSFCSIGSFDARIQDLTIENVEEGIYWWEGNLVVERCIVRGNSISYIGIGSWFDSLNVIGCGFELNGGSLGITTHPPSTNVNVISSIFSGYGTGIIANETIELNVEECNFENIGVGVQFDYGTVGSLTNSQFNNSSVIGVSITYNSTVEIRDVLFSGSKEGMRISSGSDLVGSRVVFENSTDISILLMSQAHVSLTESHILPSALGKAVWAQTFLYEHVTQDFRGNYWGTSDPVAISAMIQDSNDNSSIHTTVLFEPYADGPVPTEKKSFGSIKAMFR